MSSPAELEALLQEIRSAASVSTRTTIVLSTPYENRPPILAPAPAPDPGPGPDPL